jgi:hypothetical protein
MSFGLEACSKTLFILDKRTIIKFLKVLEELYMLKLFSKVSFLKGGYMVSVVRYLQAVITSLAGIKTDLDMGMELPISQMDPTTRV